MRSEAKMRLIKRRLVCCRYLFLAMGLVALGYCTVVLMDAALYQSWAQQQLKIAAGSPLKANRLGVTFPVAGAVSPRQQRGVADFHADMSPVGELDIPHIGLSAIIAEGTSALVLSRAVGHLRDTALPGELGNVVLAGHRDTFFRRLGTLKTGDVIKVITPQGQYVYGVLFTRIVSPGDTWVLDPSEGRTLTLVTCYPFYFVGGAPMRFIVRASILPNRISKARLSQSAEAPTKVAARVGNVNHDHSEVL
jgi:sortase A